MGDRQISGVHIPDSKLAKEVTDLVRDTEGDLLFHHSTRVYFWGALTGKRGGLTFDLELLYAAAMFQSIQDNVRIDDAVIEKYYNDHKAEYEGIKP